MDFNAPINFAEARRKQILANFGETDIMEKAVSREEFSEMYSVGHSVYTEADLNKFVAEMKEEHGDTDVVSKAISEEFSTLNMVFVKGTSGVERVFVKKDVEESTEGSKIEEFDQLV